MAEPGFQYQVAAIIQEYRCDDHPQQQMQQFFSKRPARSHILSFLIFNTMFGIKPTNDQWNRPPPRSNDARPAAKTYPNIRPPPAALPYLLRQPPHNPPNLATHPT